MKKSFIIIFSVWLALLFTFLNQPSAKASDPTWTWTQVGNELRIHYGSGTDFPQYAVLHLNDSYFRLNYGPESGWGTSVILLPVFWSTEATCPDDDADNEDGLCQGAPVTLVNNSPRVEGSELIISIMGIIGQSEQLTVNIDISLWPPQKNKYIMAQVSAKVQGSVTLIDERIQQNEGFKPVTLSSMHISPQKWDTQAAYACLRTVSIPTTGWIFESAALVQLFGLQGGVSDWQIEQQQGRPAPTIEITLDRPMPVTGWVTSSNDPNDDNVSFWAASNQVLSEWSYSIRAALAPGSKKYCISVSKRASSKLIRDGDSLTYTYYITNTSGVTLTTKVTDTFTGPPISPPGPFIQMPTIAPGDVWTDTINVTAQTGFTGSLFNILQVVTEEGSKGRAKVEVCVNACLRYLPIILKMR